MNGKGTLSNKNDQIQYEGFWKDNFKHGIGKEFNPLDNSHYEGTFSNGKKYGHGTQKWITTKESVFVPVL